MPSFSVNCPNCAAKLKLDKPELIGKKVRCPGCKEPFTVPKPKRKTSPAQTAEQSPKTRPAKKKRPQPVASAKTDDDWLDDISDEEFNSGAALAGGPPPAVHGVAQTRTRPKSSAKRKKKEEPVSRFRDEDGELSLEVHRVLMVFTGLVGGLIGAGIWAGVIYATEYEVGYIAILVGGLAGGGVRVGASRWDYGWFPAVTATIVAVVSIVAGKLIGIRALGLNLNETFQAEISEPQNALYNLLWLGLACVVAFRVAAGLTDEDDD
jgi:hypothetical protein